MVTDNRNSPDSFFYNVYMFLGMNKYRLNVCRCFPFYFSNAVKKGLICLMHMFDLFKLRE